MKKSRTARPRRASKSQEPFDRVQVHDDVVAVGEHVPGEHVVDVAGLDVDAPVRDGGNGHRITPVGRCDHIAGAGSRCRDAGSGTWIGLI